MNRQTPLLVLAILTRAVVSLVLLAIGVGLFALLLWTREEPAVSIAAEAPPQVTVMAARPVAVRRQWEGFGTAEARDSANVPAQVHSVVEEIPETIVAGASVRNGDLLVRLDDTDYVHDLRVARQRITELEAQIEQLEVELAVWLDRLELAQEDVELAERDLERAVAALSEDGALQREVDQRRQAVVAARQSELAAREQVNRMTPRRQQLQAMRAQEAAMRDLAEVNVERCRIISPMDGILQSVDVEVGEALAVDQQVARVVSLNRIEVPLRLAAGARHDVGIGAEVWLQTTGGEPREWIGRISRVAPEDDASSRSMIAYVDLEQDPSGPDFLSPGAFVHGRVTAYTARDRWIVPRRAVQSDRLRVVRDGRVESRRIESAFQIRARFPELGLSDEQWTVLEKPLERDALVVVSGTRSLSDGLVVEPVIARLETTSAGGELATRERGDATGAVEDSP